MLVPDERRAASDLQAAPRDRAGTRCRMLEPHRRRGTAAGILDACGVVQGFVGACVLVRFVSCVDEGLRTMCFLG